MLTAASESATAIDPTALALLSIFGGAALAAVFALFGAWIQGRREHKKWIRERRYEAYVSIYALMHDIASTEGHPADDPRGSIETLLDLRAQIGEIGTPIEILGPGSVSAALMTWFRASVSKDSDEAAISAAAGALRREMRKALDIRD